MNAFDEFADTRMVGGFPAADELEGACSICVRRNKEGDEAVGIDRTQGVLGSASEAAMHAGLIARAIGEVDLDRARRRYLAIEKRPGPFQVVMVKELLKVIRIARRRCTESGCAHRLHVIGHRSPGPGTGMSFQLSTRDFRGDGLGRDGASAGREALPTSITSRSVAGRLRR